MSRPLIGIEVDLETNAKGRRYAKCYETYFDRVSEAGGIPILVPPAPQAVTEALLGRLDGLVIPGGDDFHASAWGETQRPCPRYAASDDRRLEHGRRLLSGALERDLPYLGVCYGAQLLNLLRGGTLIQDLPQDWEQPLQHQGPAHSIELEPASLLARITGPDPVEVNSRHHQAVGTLGEGLRVSARAPDGVIEAIEGEGRFLLGVQWHPEELTQRPQGSGLFDALVEAARTARVV